MRKTDNLCKGDATPVTGRITRITPVRIQEKNEYVKKVFRALFVAMAGLVPARIADPVITQQVVGIIMGLGGEMAGICRI